MSAAAEASAKDVIHPKVKGSRRALLDTIATLIPEGQTMTAPISVGELATLTGYYDQAIRKAIDKLVELGVLRIVGGGRGRLASYELLALPGAGDDPLLRLFVAVAPRTARAPVGPDLFDTPVDDVIPPAAVGVRANNLGEKYQRWLQKVGDFHRRCVTKVSDFHRRLISIVTNVGTFHRRWSKKVGENHRSSHSVVDVDDARARDVHTLKNVHTHTAARSEKPDDAQPATPPIAPPRHPWHAWCGDRVCVPRFLHDEFIGKQQRVGEVRADVEARLIAFYRKRSPTGPIGDKDDAAFWRRMYGEEFATIPPRAVDRAPPRADPQTGRPPDIIGGTVCPHTPRCDRTTACIERMVAEGRAARAQQSG